MYLDYVWFKKFKGKCKGKKIKKKIKNIFKVNKLFFYTISNFLNLQNSIL